MMNQIQILQLEFVNFYSLTFYIENDENDSGNFKMKKLSSNDSDKKEPLLLRQSEVNEDPNQDLGPNIKNLNSSISSLKDSSTLQDLHT